MRAPVTDHNKRIGPGRIRPGRRDLHFPPLGIVKDEHVVPEDLALLQRFELPPPQGMERMGDSESRDSAVHMSGTMSGWLTIRSSAPFGSLCPGYAG